jgi:hypothetical protein
MAISFRHLIALFVCVSTLVAVRAQVAPAPLKEVSLQFSVFALGGAEGIGYLSKADKAPRALKFYSAYRSPQYAYKGGSRISFYGSSPAGADAVTVAVYDIPEGAGNLLLLFFPKETPSADGLKFDVYGIDDSAVRTPAGHFTTINVSGREYAGQYSGSRITIPQGVGQVHAGKGRVSLLLAAQVEGHWMPSGKHEFTMAAQDRVTLIFYPSASRTGVYPIIRRLTDTLPIMPGEKESVVAQYP